MPRMLYVDGGSSGLGRERTRLLRRGRALSHVGLHGQQLLIIMVTQTSPLDSVGQVLLATTLLAATAAISIGKTGRSWL